MQLECVAEEHRNDMNLYMRVQGNA